MHGYGVSRVRLVLATLLLSLMTVIGGAAGAGAGAVTAQATPAADAAVKVVGTRARIAKDGKVAVRLKTRCPATYQAFEMNVSVSQGESFGYVFRIGPPNVLVCDGRWHGSVVKVAPSTGKFRKGWADVEVSVQFYDTVQGNDTSAGAGAQLRLVHC